MPRRHISLRDIWPIVIAILTASSYAVLAILNLAPMSWFIFFSWLGFLVLINSFIFLNLWREKIAFTLQTKIVLFLWSTLVFWYWLFAPFYYYLNINVDLLQIKWVAFAYFWEVPIVGGLFIIISMLLFRPVQRFLTKDHSHSVDLKFLRSFVSYYPLVVSLMIFIFTVIGYIIGSLQFRFFGFQPPAEGAKTILNGISVSLFLAAFYYLSIDNFLGEVRTEIEKAAHYKKLPTGKVSFKILITTFIIALGSISLVFLFALSAFQQIVQDLLVDRINEKHQSAQVILINNSNQEDVSSLLNSVNYGSSINTYFLDFGQNNIMGDFSDETRAFFASGQNGAVIDVHNQSEIIVISDVAEISKRLVSVVNISDFNMVLRNAFRFLFFAAVFAVLVSLAVITVLSSTLTQSLRRLTLSVEKAANKDAEVIHLDSGDELEELSHAFINYVKKTREVDRLKDEFIAFASHQLRTPLTAIRNISSALEEGTYGKVNEKAQKQIKIVSISATRLINLVNSLLDVSKIQSGKVAINFTMVPVAEIISKVYELLSKEAEQKGIKVVIKDYSSDISVYTDSAKAIEILTNLVANAIKFTEEGTITLKVEKEEKTARILVTDTGLGIDPEDQKKLFDRFEQLTISYNQRPEGFGLGLYLAKHLAQAIKADIELVHSKKGDGSTFAIIFPLNEVKEDDDSHSH